MGLDEVSGNFSILIFYLPRVFLFILAVLFSSLLSAATSVAFYYGKSPPLKALSVFDIVVVDPDHVPNPAVNRKERSTLFAYVSVGEVAPDRSYVSSIPLAWQRGKNTDWKSIVLDVSQSDFPRFLAETVVAPLWKNGYRGFFLDTLDSYRLIADADPVAMQRGLVAAIKYLHQQFPGIRLIANRGFELLPSIAGQLEMVAAESLFRRFRAASGDYVEVPEEDRRWLLGQLLRARDEFRLPVVSIDYVPPDERDLARETAKKISALGVVPWVANGALDTLGIGKWEVVPRHVIVFYDSAGGVAPEYSPPGRHLATSLEYLGMVPEYHSLQSDLPELDRSRHAGVILWPSQIPSDEQRIAHWVTRQIGRGFPVSFFGQFGLSLMPEQRRSLGLEITEGVGAGEIKITHQDAMIGFESRPIPSRQSLLPIHLRYEGTENGRSLLSLNDGRGKDHVAAAIMPWGGYVLNPFVVSQLPGTEQHRLVLDPFAFLVTALRLPFIPVPDVTTENGRRLAFIHIDGDGFPSRGEFSGDRLDGQFASAILRDEVLKRYRLPTTMSIIEGEIGAKGLYPALSPSLEQIARDIFALPYVDIASHSFSHPFRWYRAEGVKRSDESEKYHLEIPGYTFNLNREIEGSIDYIDRHLAPAGKKTRVFLWTGDAEPTTNAIDIINRRGIRHLNGGITLASKSFPSLSAVSPMGVDREGRFQTFSATTNENRYTNLWTGPFYGFSRVTETFEFTDKPRRLKPINLYYHTYSASKKASLSALHKVYDWIIKAEPHYIHAADYIDKVADFRTMIVARRIDDSRSWRISGDGALRTLRLPKAMQISLGNGTQVSGVAGWVNGSDGAYLHLRSGEPEIEFQPESLALLAPPVMLNEANARLMEWSPIENGVRFSLAGLQPLRFSLSTATACALNYQGEKRSPSSTNTTASGGLRISHFQFDDAAGTFEVHCS